MVDKNEFEKIVLRDDIVDYLLSKSKDEIQEMFGDKVSRMVKYDQDNSWHCYDLWEHTLRVVDGIKRDGLTIQEYKNLRIAGFFHDIGKPETKRLNPKTGQSSFHGHPIKSAEIAMPILQQMGYSVNELEQIIFFVAHHDDFMNYKLNAEPNSKNSKQINLKNISEKIKENMSKSKFGQSLENYKLLLRLCRSDSGAQSEVVIRNGNQVGSRKESLANIEAIENVLEKVIRDKEDDRGI